MLSVVQKRESRLTYSTLVSPTLTYLIYSATHNPNVSDEGKASAEQKLAEMGASDGSSSKGKGDESSGGMTDAKKALLDEGKDPVRVEAGLKA